MWQNQEPQNKNLESIINEFSLENIRGANILTEEPALTEIGEGEFRLVYLSGTLYKYTRYNDTLYRQTWTAV